MCGWNEALVKGFLDSGPSAKARHRYRRRPEVSSVRAGWVADGCELSNWARTLLDTSGWRVGSSVEAAGWVRMRTASLLAYWTSSEAPTRTKPTPEVAIEWVSAWESGALVPLGGLRIAPARRARASGDTTGVTLSRADLETKTGAPFPRGAKIFACGISAEVVAQCSYCIEGRLRYSEVSAPRRCWDLVIETNLNHEDDSLPAPAGVAHMARRINRQEMGR